jgi:hypothetical protein
MLKQFFNLFCICQNMNKNTLRLLDFHFQNRNRTLDKIPTPQADIIYQGRYY